jgi:hypothetical protein
LLSLATEKLKARVHQTLGRYLHGTPVGPSTTLLVPNKLGRLEMKSIGAEKQRQKQKRKGRGRKRKGNTKNKTEKGRKGNKEPKVTKDE